jgi:conjugative transfer signal peptidase TraF
MILVATAAIIGPAAIPHRIRLIWNASASAPIGLYSVTKPEALRPGDMVVAWPPPAARKLGAERHYIPFDVPLVKRIAAMAGDTACATGTRLTVNGIEVGRRRLFDGDGRWMPWWHGCVSIGYGEVLLLMDNAVSFDGRYFGLSRAADIVGKARLLWP